MSVRIMRAVVSSSTRNNPGFGKHWAVGGSRTLVLECGHKQVRKQSQAQPVHARCLQCEQLRGGGTSATKNVDGTWTCERWDDETQRPKVTITSTNPCVAHPPHADQETQG